MNTGVYAIVYIGPLAEGKTAKWYIGSTGRDFETRWAEHRYHLNSGNHQCRHLQNAWNKHGEELFAFVIVERVLARDTAAAEQLYFDAEREYRCTGRGNLYNRSLNAKGGGWEISAEIRASMSAGQLRRDPATQPHGERHGSKTHPECVVRGDAQWMRKHPERVRRGRDACPFPERMIRGDAHWTRRNPEAMMGEHNAAAKLTTSDVVEIRRRYAAGEPQATLATAFNVQQSAVSRIIAGKRWSHVQDPPSPE